MKQIIILNIVVFSIVFCLTFIACDDKEDCTPDGDKGDGDNNDDLPIDEDDFCNEKSGPNEAGETWTDSSSGLMWQKVPYNCELNWYDAFEYCDLLKGDGHFDWRLPTISELRSLIRGCPATETGGSCGVTDDCLNKSCSDDSCYSCHQDCDNGCCWPSAIDGKCGIYWSSSEETSSENNGARWVVRFRHGEIRQESVLIDDETSLKYDNKPIRCVRTMD